MLKARENN